MTGIRWTADLGDDHLPVWRLDEQSDYTGRWEIVAEVIHHDLPDGGLGFAVWAAEDVQSVHGTLDDAKAAAESWWDNRCEAAWESRNADPDVVTLREQAWSDHADAEVLHDRRVA